MFRKVIFLGGAVLIPVWFGIEKIFYTEPVSDFISVVVSLTVTLLTFEQVIKGSGKPAFDPKVRCGHHDG